MIQQMPRKKSIGKQLWAWKTAYMFGCDGPRSGASENEMPMQTCHPMRSCIKKTTKINFDSRSIFNLRSTLICFVSFIPCIDAVIGSLPCYWRDTSWYFHSDTFLCHAALQPSYSASARMSEASCWSTSDDERNLLKPMSRPIRLMVLGGKWKSNVLIYWYMRKDAG